MGAQVLALCACATGVCEQKPGVCREKTSASLQAAVAQDSETKVLPVSENVYRALVMAHIDAGCFVTTRELADGRMALQMRPVVALPA